jgi:hypothetical protein
MALVFEVESLDGVDEGFKSLYQEHNGKYRLAVEGIDPADELKKPCVKSVKKVSHISKRRKS